MTDCNDDDVQRVLPSLGYGSAIQTPDPDTAILVTDAVDKFVRTVRAEHDVHTAIVRGLASYVAGLETAIAGRLISISRVVANFADHDDGPVPSPSASVAAVEIGRYRTDSGMAPGTPIQIAPGRGHSVVSLTCSGIYELEQLEVCVMCEDDVQRAGVRRMLEDAFWPVTWMSGFRLVLPRYHNAVCTFTLETGQQADASDTAAAGIRPLAMRLRARCPVYRVHELPLARPTATGTIMSGKRRT